MTHIRANDPKTRGVAAIEASLADHPAAILSVRGKGRDDVMDLAQDHYLRACELAAAWRKPGPTAPRGVSWKNPPRRA